MYTCISAYVYIYIYIHDSMCITAHAHTHRCIDALRLRASYVEATGNTCQTSNIDSSTLNNQSITY